MGCDDWSESIAPAPPRAARRSRYPDYWNVARSMTLLSGSDIAPSPVLLFIGG